MLSLLAECGSLMSAKGSDRALLLFSCLNDLLSDSMLLMLLPCTLLGPDLAPRGCLLAPPVLNGVAGISSDGLERSLVGSASKALDDLDGVGDNGLHPHDQMLL